MSLRQRKLQALISSDGLVAENLATGGIFDGEADGEIDRSDETCHCDDSLGVEDVEKLRPATVQGAYQLLGMNPDIVEEDVG